MGERHMWIAIIIGFIIFRILKDTDTVLGLAFSIAPDPCNRIEYPLFTGNTYANGIHFFYETK